MRNRLRGQIEELLIGDLISYVVVRVGENLVESAITRRGAEEHGLKKGDTVTVVLRSTEVAVIKSTELAA